VSFAAITLCVTFQRVFIVVSIYFVIDSVRKLLDTPSYEMLKRNIFLKPILTFGYRECVGVVTQLCVNMWNFISTLTALPG
jgi:hypothetical protein